MHSGQTKSSNFKKYLREKVRTSKLLLIFAPQSPFYLRCFAEVRTYYFHRCSIAAPSLLHRFDGEMMVERCRWYGLFL